jgi:outer membrane protein assembly factor BamB
MSTTGDPTGRGAATGGAAGAGAGAAASPPPARTWPLALLLFLAAGGLWASRVWGLGYVAPLYVGISILLLLSLLVWLFAFSRLQGRRRLVGLVSILGVSGLLMSVLRIRGYTGDLVPIFELWFQRRAPVELDVTGEEVRLVPSAHDSPEFLGPGRRPEFPVVPLLRDWKARAPKVRWRMPVGEGFSSFAAVGEYAFTQMQLGDDESVVCFHWPTGNVPWAHRDRVRLDNDMGHGPRATPTVHDGRVYSLGGTGLFNCLDAATGKRLWSHDLVGRFDGRQPPWGYAGSPLIVDGLVVVSSGAAARSSLLAFDRVTGELRWRAGDRETAYASPVLAEVAGERVILQAERPGLTAYRAADGEELWHASLGGGENCSQPVVLDGNLVFYSKEYGQGSHLWRLAKTADGRLAGETVWQSRRVMKTKFTQPVHYEGRFYGISAGMGFECLDPRTGQVAWFERGGFGHGQSLRTGDLILSVTEQGELLLIEANPDRYVELGRHRLFTSRTWNQPVLIGTTLLARNDLEAVCVDLPVAGGK